MSGPIYTRDGDEGETSLANGARVSKNSARVAAYGAIDEASSHVGLVRAALEVAVPEEATLDRMLDFVQHRLFNCAGRLAMPDESANERTPDITPEDIATLESFIDSLSAETGEFEHFVLPSGCELAVRLHVARTVVRRAELAILALADVEPVDRDVLAFVNRLSDLLFAMARYANLRFQGGDVFWDPDYVHE